MSEASRYLLVLYIAEKREPGPIAPGTIADALERSPSAATEMLQRLEERGLVAREPYEGATLTPDGRETAEELYGTYTTLSQFFHGVLELEDHEREALRLAGNVSPVVAERLASTLDFETDTEAPNEQSVPSFLRSNSA
jgi:Mn-dependent DtxR family transcriptional regulator